MGHQYIKSIFKMVLKQNSSKEFPDGLVVKDLVSLGWLGVRGVGRVCPRAWELVQARGAAKKKKKKSLLKHFFFFFLGPHLQHMDVPRLGVELDPIPQQFGIRAVSATYTAAHGDATLDS